MTSEPWTDLDYTYPEIGETHEHLLIGSPAWERAKQYEADRDRKEYSIHPHIAGAVRDYILGTRPVARIVSHDETTTGAQLHYTIINRIEIGHALQCLRDVSETDYDRYLAVTVHSETEESLAATGNVLARDIRQSLYRARRVLARSVREYLPE